LFYRKSSAIVALLSFVRLTTLRYCVWTHVLSTTHTFHLFFPFVPLPVVPFHAPLDVNVADAVLEFWNRYSRGLSDEHGNDSDCAIVCCNHAATLIEYASHQIAAFFKSLVAATFVSPAISGAVVRRALPTTVSSFDLLCRRQCR
jgi:hypothetical protein